jgi:hypothetical protein
VAIIWFEAWNEGRKRSNLLAWNEGKKKQRREQRKKKRQQRERRKKKKQHERRENFYEYNKHWKATVQPKFLRNRENIE